MLDYPIKSLVALSSAIMMDRYTEECIFISFRAMSKRIDFAPDMDPTTLYKFDIVATILPSFFLTFLMTTFSAYVHTNFLLEFALFTFPLVLNLTTLAPHIHEFLFTLILTCFTFLVITTNCRMETLKPSSTTRLVPKHVPFVTNIRSIINLITCISILAVDFQVFPRRFLKTDRYGFSLMDLGVGLFIYSNGIVAPEVVARKPFLKIVKSSLPLLALGLLRLSLTSAVNYNVPVEEYGRHWNFFFTLFFVKLTASLVLNCIGNKYVLVNAISLLFAHEILLQMGLANYVLNDKSRDNFFSANKEGIVSSLGYVALYFLSMYVGKELHLKNTSKSLAGKFKLFKKLVIFSALLFFCTVYLERAFGVSRRLANTGYCIWTMFVGIFMTGLFCFGEIVQQYLFEIKGNFKARYTPQILEAINYNGLVFFLVSNVLTGVINLSVDTKSCSDHWGVFVVSLYMLVTSGICTVLYRRNVQLKL